MTVASGRQADEKQINLMNVVAIDRDQCLTPGLDAPSTNGKVIATNNPQLVTALKEDLCTDKTINIIRNASSGQNFAVNREHSNFASHIQLPNIQMPDKESLVPSILSKLQLPDYASDYSKVLIYLCHMFNLQLELQEPDLENITHVNYYFIDDKKEKLEAIAAALALRPDLVPPGVTIHLGVYKFSGPAPVFIHTIKSQNQNLKDIHKCDFGNIIKTLLQEYEDNIIDPIFIAKEAELRTKGYNRPSAWIDLSLSIQTTAAKNAPNNNESKSTAEESRASNKLPDNLLEANTQGRQLYLDYCTRHKIEPTSWIKPETSAIGYYLNTLLLDLLNGAQYPIKNYHAALINFNDSVLQTRQASTPSNNIMLVQAEYLILKLLLKEGTPYERNQASQECLNFANKLKAKPEYSKIGLAMQLIVGHILQFFYGSYQMLKKCSTETEKNSVLAKAQNTYKFEAAKQRLFTAMTTMAAVTPEPVKIPDPNQAKITP